MEKTRHRSDASTAERINRPDSASQAPAASSRARTLVLNAYGNPEYSGELRGPLERDDLVPRFPLNRQ